MKPIIQLANISSEIVLMILEGIKGACWIVIEVVQPTRAGEAVLVRLSGNNEGVNDLMPTIKVFAAREIAVKFVLSIFRSFVPTESPEDADTFGLTKRIEAPQIPPEKWQALNRREKTKLLIREILDQTCWNQTRLSKSTGTCRSHISNTFAGVRVIGWNFAMQLIKLPMTEEMVKLIRETAQRRPTKTA